MDPFTKNMLDRAEQRSRKIGISDTSKFPLNEVNRHRNETNVVRSPTSRAIGSRQSGAASKENAITYTTSAGNKRSLSSRPDAREDKYDYDNINVEINITTDANVGVKCDVISMDVDADGNVINSREIMKEEANPSLRDISRSRLQRLGALYSENQDLSSPIHRTEAKFHESTSASETTQNKMARCKSHKLTALANTINNWEDESIAPGTSGTTASSAPKPSPRTISQPESKGAIKKGTVGPTSSSSPTKHLKWDKSVIDALENQGFKRRQSQNDRLQLDLNDKRERENQLNERVRRDRESKPNAIDSNKDLGAKSSPKKLNVGGGSVSSRAALFENKTDRSNRGIGTSNTNYGNKNKDPAELSLKERLAIFEKNKGTAVMPKAPLTQPIPILKNVTANNLSKGSAIPEPPALPTFLMKSNQVVDASPTKKKPVVGQSESSSRAQGLGVQRTISALASGRSAISEAPKRRSDIDDSIETTSSSNSPSSTTPEEAKRPKKSPQSNRLYPVLSDVEDNYTTATVSDDNNRDIQSLGDDYDEEYSGPENNGLDNSMGRAILESIRKQEVSNISTCDSSSDDGVDDSDEYGDELDDYLDEALGNSSRDGRHSRKASMSSDSFSYSKRNGNDDNLNPTAPMESKLTITSNEDQPDVMTLVHTVSFYRKQQKLQNSPESSGSRSRAEDKSEKNKKSPYKSSHDHRSTIERQSDEGAKVEAKIKKLMLEVYKQQHYIAQSSQAINLCAATVEFSGSSEAVEGERHLLVATHRRQAAMNEVQRLRVEGDLHGNVKDRGQVTISEITLPLRQDYIRRLSTDTISGHHLVCLVKYAEQVVATRTVPTLPGLLAVKFPDTITLPDVATDFKITLEIYGMTAQREVLPHDIKYHITPIKKQKSSLLTPKGKKGHAESNLLFMPSVQSPGGPNAVRSPGMVQYGFVIFSMREVRRSNWTLNTVSAVSPLEGSVHMKVDCQMAVSVDYQGFLTMFEDSSGFGAWHRRWCRLHGSQLSYWKYPDDEKTKAPIGMIDLSQYVNMKVTKASRDVCARLNTLLFEVQRERRASDEESLVTTIVGPKTVRIKYLLSSDTKEERDEWMEQLNKSLSVLHSCGNE